jgi:glycosyltransferase involved in cell wall biosynthesis
VRIAFLSQPWARALPPSESVAIWTHEVARRLAAQHDVSVWARRHAGDEPVRKDAGVEYRTVAGRGDYRLLRTLKPAFSSGLYHPVYHIEVARRLRSWQPDVIHVHNFSQAVPLLRRAVPNAAIVLHMHCEWLNLLDRRTIAPRVAKADALVGCSDYVTDRIRAAFPEAAGRAHTLYNGVDVGAFAPAECGRDGPVRLLAIGRISPEKGTHVLLDAFGRLDAAVLDLVGDEAMPEPAMLVDLDAHERVRALRPLYREGYLRDALDRLPAGARDRVRLHGKVPHADAPAVYAVADVLVSPSVCEEPFGMQNAEAAAAGIPVVTTRVGGTVEVIEDGIDGLLVPPADADALTAALERVAADPELRRRLGAAGRERAVERFSWDVIAPATLDVYRRVTSA